MKIIVVRDCSDLKVDSGYELDLRQKDLKDCIGCWSCWLKTPGKCIHRDLDEFYQKYLEADKVIIFSKIHKGFVSGRMKTLIDRLIPLFLPYVDVSGEDGMNHEPRYDKYPDVEFYFDGVFHSCKGKEILQDYIVRTFTQFRSKRVSINEINEFRKGNVNK